MTAPPDRIWSRPSNVSGVLAFDHPAVAASEYVLLDGPKMQAAIAAADARIAALEAGLREAERFMAYFAGETGGSFSGPGTPQSCLAAIRALIPAPPDDGGDNE